MPTGALKCSNGVSTALSAPWQPLSSVSSGLHDSCLSSYGGLGPCLHRRLPFQAP